MSQWMAKQIVLQRDPSRASRGMDRALPPRSFIRRYASELGFSFAIVSLATFLFIRYGQDDTLFIDKGRLTISTVQRGSFREFLPLSGVIAPIDSVYVDIAEPGQVAEVLAEAGSMVDAGQVLIRLTSTTPENELMNSENLLAQQVNALSGTKLQYEQTRLNTERSIIDMHAELEKLTTGYQRMLRLKDSGAIKQAEIDDTAIEIRRQQQSLAAMEKSLTLSETEGRKQIDTMQRVIDTLNSKLTLARMNLDALHVRAPISGQLTNFNVHIGQRLMPAQRIGQIDQLDHNKIVAAVDEFYLNRVSVKQTATATIDGKTYSLTVAKIYPEVHDRVFNVDFIFNDTAPPNIRIGQSTQLRLDISAISDVMVVANGTFYETANQGVFVINANGTTAQRRMVTFGRRNVDQVEVLGGLAAGEQIVISSYQTLHGINQLRFK